MGLPLEKHLESKIVKWCKDNKFLCIKFTSLSTRGLPDRLIIGDGRVVFVEIKRKGKKPREYQEYMINLMKRKGADVFWCDNFESFEEHMNNGNHIHRKQT